MRQVEVVVEVRFSEAERLVISRRQLGDFIVLKREPDSLTARRRELVGLKTEPERFHLLVDDLLRKGGDRFTCDTPVHAKIYSRELARGLKSLKIFIAENEVVRKTTEFEL